MELAKLDPNLATALCDFIQDGPEAFEREIESDGPIRVIDSAQGPAVRVFIECVEDSKLDGLNEAGVRLGAGEGRVRTALVPFSFLGELTEHPEIDYVTPSHRVFAQMDKAALWTRLDDWRQSLGPNAATGRGVLIGVIDSGIDVSHSAFAGRIAEIWDQNIPGPGVPEGDYGTVLHDSQMTLSKDTSGHGTHVAGIAAGGSEHFRGVAPEATLLPVKFDYQDDQLADALRYIFRVAEQQGMPAVVNISYGGHDNGHDGADPLSKVIDDLSAPGRIVCCAAGNDGKHPIHSGADVPAGGQATMQFASSPRPFSLSGWYPSDNLFSVQIVTPSGARTEWKDLTEWVRPRWEDLVDARVRVSPPTGSGHRPGNVKIQITPGAPGTAGGAGTWELVWRNDGASTGRVDVWIVGDGRPPSVPAGTLESAGTTPAPKAGFVSGSSQPLMLIGSPGSASSAITVASYTTRTWWLIPTGQKLERHDLRVGAISPFSSAGPRRDGTLKPDLAAPGAMIVSCRSKDSEPSQITQVSSEYCVMGGTSMACPFIAGVVALILERQPTISPDEVKYLLNSACSMKDQPAGQHDVQGGYGLIDVARALGG